MAAGPALIAGIVNETALFRVLSDLSLSMIDAGGNALLVLLHLSAAFDTVDHSLLLKNLHGELFCVGYCSRVVLVTFVMQIPTGQSYSVETPLLGSVPQGSVLGRLLFSLYTRQAAS